MKESQNNLLEYDNFIFHRVCVCVYMFIRYEIFLFVLLCRKRCSLWIYTIRDNVGFQIKSAIEGRQIYYDSVFVERR